MEFAEHQFKQINELTRMNLNEIRKETAFTVCHKQNVSRGKIPMDFHVAFCCKKEIAKVTKDFSNLIFKCSS